MKPVPHGEPYAGKLHVRFEEGYPPKNGEVRFEGSRRPSGRTRRGALRSTLLAGVYDPVGPDAPTFDLKPIAVAVELGK